MDELKELYQETILDHNKSPRNFGVMDNASHHAEGFNPLCGDHYDVYMNIVEGNIEDISFEGSGCAISKSSASIMTTLLQGKTIEEAKTMFEQMHDLLTEEPSPDLAELGKLAVFAGVREFPVRVKCATLAWHTMISAVDNKKEITSTE